MDKANIKKIKAKYILKHIFDLLPRNKCLNIIKYNKSIQNKLDININDYKEYTQIEIEVFPTQKERSENNNYFINILKKKDKSYYHIYFDDNRTEINKCYLTKKDKVQKIKLIIDCEVKSLKGLFKDCDCIQKINIIKCNRKDIKDMSQLFLGCVSLEELNLSNLNTHNVTDMSEMISGCVSLEELNLSNFNTNNVINMSNMFARSYSLR